MEQNTYRKNFNKWNIKKTDLDLGKKRIFFHNREIWFSHLGTNIGFEQDGKGENFGRPVIIFRKFNNQIFWAIPLTSKNKVGKFYFPIDLGDGKCRVAILSQLRLLDAKRLYQKFSVINEKTYKLLQEQVIKLCQDL